MQLPAYLFVRENGAGNLGHVGYGFAMGNGRFVCGATEQVVNGVISDNNEGSNQHWFCEVGSEALMLAEMRKDHFANLLKPNDHNRYDDYKSVLCPSADPAAALAKAKQMSKAGYCFVGNNCLDHATDVLEAFGLGWHPNGLMPWKQTNAAPNKFFKEFPGNKVRL